MALGHRWSWLARLVLWLLLQKGGRKEEEEEADIKFCNPCCLFNLAE